MRKVYCVALALAFIFGAKGVVNAQENTVAVDLGLSVKWASCNIGAKSPEERLRTLDVSIPPHSIQKGRHFAGPFFVRPSVGAKGDGATGRCRW